MKSTEINIITLTGPEGSGKSTQGKVLAVKRAVPFISTGDMLRERAANDWTTSLGAECRQMFADHVYLAPRRMLEVIADRLKREDILRGVVLDGGFRTVEETELFGEMLESTGKNFAVEVIFLKVPGWVCAQRLMGEGGRKRVDDTPEGWLRRMGEFNNGLGRRMSIIRNRWSLEIVNANKSAKEVGEEIIKRLVSKNL